MIRTVLPIDRLIAVVREGGSIKTGVDVYDRTGTLLLAGDVLVDKVKTLEVISRSGVRRIPLARDGGIFDRSGRAIEHPEAQPDLDPEAMDASPKAPKTSDVEIRLREIKEIRKEAALMISRARETMKAALAQIREEKGQFDVDAVKTQVGDMVSFSLDAGHPGAYLGRDLFSFDNYLYLHAVNVCAMGTVVAHRFNAGFSSAVETSLWSQPSWDSLSNSFSYYLPDDLDDISLGLFLFDIGKALVPQPLLQKSTALTREERNMVQRHSYEFGTRILEANHLTHPVLANMVSLHHAPIFDGEKGGYPRNRPADEIPL